MAGALEVWRATAGGCALRVRLTPRAAADSVNGVRRTAEGPALLVRVRAVPERGAANLALEKLIAGWLGVPRSTVQVAAGGKSRLKTVTIAGEGDVIGQQIRDRLRTLG
jgi:uncharacterized protein YggU (UPF0235/DUF167 family)